MRRKFLGVLVLVIGLTLLLGCPVFGAEPMLSYVREMTFPGDGLEKIGTDSQVPDLTFSGNWTFLGNVNRESKLSLEGTSVVSCTVKQPDEAQGQVELRYRSVLDLAPYRTLSFLMNVEAQADVEYYKVTVRTTRRKTVYEAVSYVKPNGWQEINVDISDRDWTDAVSVIVEFEGEATPDKINLAPLILGQEDRLRYMERYSAAFLTEDVGYVRYSKSSATVYPNNGTARVTGYFSLPKRPAGGMQSFLLVTMEGEGISAGSLACSIEDVEGNELVDGMMPSIALSNGRYVYSYPFVSSEEMVAYHLSFRNVEQSGRKGLKILSVEVIETAEERNGEHPWPGEVSSVTLESGGLVFRGKVDSDVLRTHLKDDLVLYAVPYMARFGPTELPSMESSVELMRKELSISFTMTLSEEITRRYMGTHRFYLAIVRTENGVTERRLLYQPLGIPEVEQATGISSTEGIDGASTVGVFESNASHVIVELPMERLVYFADSENGKNPSSPLAKYTLADGSTVYIDEDFLDDIAAEISFYHSAGIAVYLRLTEEVGDTVTQITSMTNSDVNLYSALLAYFLRREYTVSGVIIGKEIAYDETDFPDFSLLHNYAVRLTSLMRVTYSTAYTYVDPTDFKVVVPFRYGGSMNGLVMQVLASHMDQIGSVPWSMMYTFESLATKDGLEEAQELFNTAKSFSDGNAESLMAFCEPGGEIFPESLASQYHTVCDSARQYKVRAVFISVDGMENDQKEIFYRSMKDNRNSEDSRIDVAEAVEIPAADAWLPKNLFTIWDFSDSYYSENWVSASSASTCRTGGSAIFTAENGEDTRVLKTKINPDYEDGVSNSIILRNLSRTVNFSQVESLRFAIAISGTEELSTVIFTIGNDTERVEFYLNDAEPGRVYYVTCPLAGRKGLENIRYIGIMAYSGNSATLELGKVEVTSNRMNYEALRGLFVPGQTTAPEPGYGVYYMGGFALALSLCILALLIRRDKEEVKQRAEELELKKKKYGRPAR